MALEVPKKPRAIPATAIAPCGMNCALCRAYRPDKSYIKPCPGCRGDDSRKPRSCASCKIKLCEHLAITGGKYCFDCPEFPCARLKRLDKRYRTRYGMSMLENLQNIKEAGIRHFIRSEQEKWICPGCGELICVHKPQCLRCGYNWQ